jgi:hypothetical protein
VSGSRRLSRIRTAEFVVQQTFASRDRVECGLKFAALVCCDCDSCRVLASQRNGNLSEEFEAATKGT